VDPTHHTLTLRVAFFFAALVTLVLPPLLLLLSSCRFFPSLVVATVVLSSLSVLMDPPGPPIHAQLGDGPEAVIGGDVPAFVGGGGSVFGRASGRGGGRIPAGRAGRGGGRAGRAGGAGRAGRGAGQGRQRAGSGPRFVDQELVDLNEAIGRILPLGSDEWNQVANEHAELYPAYNRGVDSLRRKFREMCATQVPTGDPTCPPHIRQAKRLYLLIQDRSDADNFDGTELDIGLEEDANVVANATDENEVANATDESEVANATDGNGGDASVRRLFAVPVTAPRPLVRTPLSSRRRHNNNNNGSSDITSALVATLAASSRSEERERRERRRDRREDRRDRQMNQFMMMTMIGMMNPAAANVTLPIRNDMAQQMRRSLNFSTELVDSSSDNESDEHD
jgi:hypothetical protein